MISQKYYILLFQYDKIDLFTEINGKITKVNFSEDRKTLSNCVTFSFTKEDLEFVPDGDPFEVNSNSPFSDYLDFAGYHFETEQALDVIVESIIRNNMIPGLKRNDDIFVCIQTSYFETSNETQSEEIGGEFGRNKNKKILGHSIYEYDYDVILCASINLLRHRLSRNIIIGQPFMTNVIMETENGHTFVGAPTIERNVVEEVNKTYPLPTHVPEKLLRNVRNRIIVSKLYNLQLPEKAIYQNRIIDVAHAQLSERFNEVIKGDIELFLKDSKAMFGDPTIVFDFGMHPAIKDAFLSISNNPVFANEEEKNNLICFILRNMIIQHKMINDLVFRSHVLQLEKADDLSEVVFKFNGIKCYDMEAIIEGYFRFQKKPDLISNKETRTIEEIKNKRG